MKKILTLFALLVLTVTGAQAQTHVAKTGQNYLSETSLKAGVDAATGSYLVALQIHAGSTFYINDQGKTQASFSSTGATTWIVEKTSDGKYLLKTFSGNYIKTLGGNNNTAATFTTNSSEALKFNPVQSASIDPNMESGYVANKAIWWNVDGGGNRINTNAISGTQKTIFQNGGEGCWTCLFTYEVTLKYTITFKCYSGGTLIDTVEGLYADGETVDVPTITGYTLADGESATYTVNGANAEYDVQYDASTFDYTFTVVGAPEGTTFTVKGDAAASGDALSFQDAVTAEDVVATFPTGYEYMVANVTIDGGTITVTCDDSRWPINIDKNTNNTRTDRYTNSVTLNDQTISVPGGQQAPNGKVYNDLTSESFTFAPGEQVQPTFGFVGGAMMGFVYIDLNNDGDFTDDGELVSYNNNGSNPTNRLDNTNRQTPAFTLPTTTGSYRMRFKVDWASLDPAGTTDIASNGGAFIDVTLAIVDPCDLLDDKIQAATNAYNEVSDMAGTLGYPKQEVVDALYAAIEAAGNANGDCAEHIEALATAVNNLKAAENRVMPQAGNFYRIKGIVSGLYLQSNANATQTDRLSATAGGTDATTIFYLDEGNKLLGFANGLYATNTCSPQTDIANNVSGAQAYTIAALEAYGEFSVKGGGYLYSWPTSEKADPYFDRNGNTWHERCRMAIEAVEELPITLRSTDNVNYFATFSAPVNVQITGATLNAVEKKTKTASYTAVDTDELPAGTGVLLTGTEASATATIITDEVAAADYGLVRYYAATAGTGATDKLYLGKGKTSGKAGFYKLGEGTTSNGFKAYLEDTAAASGEAKEGFELVFGGEVTGIDAIENAADNGAVFNLQGQRVNKAQKGIYIQNGKKVVLK